MQYSTTAKINYAGNDKTQHHTNKKSSKVPSQNKFEYVFVLLQNINFCRA